MNKYEQVFNLFGIGRIVDRLFMRPSVSDTTYRQLVREGDVLANDPDVASSAEASKPSGVQTQTDVEQRRRVIEAVEFSLLRG